LLKKTILSDQPTGAIAPTAPPLDPPLVLSEQGNFEKIVMPRDLRMVYVIYLMELVFTLPLRPGNFADLRLLQCP